MNVVGCVCVVWDFGEGVVGCGCGVVDVKMCCGDGNFCVCDVGGVCECVGGGVVFGVVGVCEVCVGECVDEGDDGGGGEVGE